jgi:hypothetical protein
MGTGQRAYSNEGRKKKEIPTIETKYGAKYMVIIEMN